MHIFIKHSNRMVNELKMCFTCEQNTSVLRNTSRWEFWSTWKQRLMFSRGHNRWIVTPYQQNLDNTTFITTFNYLIRQQYIPFRKYSDNLTLECMAQPVKRRVTNYWKKFLFISVRIGPFLIIFYCWKFPFIYLCF